MDNAHPNAQDSFSRRDFVKVASLAGTAITSGLGLSPAGARAAPVDAQAGNAGNSTPAKTLIGFRPRCPM